MPSMMSSGKKPKPTEKFDPKAFGKILKYGKKNWPAIVFSLLCAIVGTIATIIGPEKIGELTNLITKGIFFGVDMTEFAKVGTYLIIIYSVGAIFSYAQQYIMAIVTQKISNKLPLKYFDQTTKGDILSRITNDVDTLSQTLGSTVANLVSSIVLFIGVLIKMFQSNWILSFVTIGSSLVGFVFMGLIITNMRKFFVKRQEYLGLINGHIEEVYSNMEVVKSYNATAKEKAKFDEHNKNIYNVGWKAQFFSGMMGPMMSFVGNLAYVLIFIVGVSIILDGGTGVTLGTLMSFIIYARLFSQPLTTFAQSMNSMQEASAASKRVFELLEQKELASENDKKAYLGERGVVGNVEFRNVRFAYDSDKTIIHNFSANLKAGQKVAIVGPTGAGKTTMVNLLMRFYELKQPRLILNGKITEYKVFDNGKSIRISFDDDNNLIVNGQKTDYILENKLPKNCELKFNQNFELIDCNDSQEKPLNQKIDVIVGDKLDDVSDQKFAIAYYGDIFIDNTPIKSLKRENLHDLFDMILQDTWLFNGTVKENLIYNTQNVLDEKLSTVCSAVGLTHFIDTLPNGFDTMLTDVSSLSEGQKQQLTIARAMIKDSPLLILDEATSNVDTRTEVAIQKAMDELTKGRTSFVIAHRLSTIKNADIILVMKDGDIIEYGNHKELLDKNGFYAELYNSQFATSE